MARKRKHRRQPHEFAWHWKQTNSWYFTQPGTKKRVPLLDEDGERIRGKDNKEAAKLALARIRLELVEILSTTSTAHWPILITEDVGIDLFTCRTLFNSLRICSIRNQWILGGPARRSRLVPVLAKLLD